MSATAILATISGKQHEISNAIPKTFRGAMAYESIRQSVALACEKSDRLAKCSPRSVYAALLDAVRLGLDVSPLRQQAFLVPFYDSKTKGYKCQLIVGAQGKIEMAYRSGNVTKIVTNVVHENDDFAFDLASGDMRHTFDWRNPGDRGEIVAAYARIWLKHGGDPIQELMTTVDFAKIVESHKQKNRGNMSPAYRDWYGEMFRRSVLNRALKRAPKSVDIAEMLERESGIEAKQVAGEMVDAAFEEVNAPSSAPAIAKDEDLLIDIEADQQQAVEAAPVATKGMP